MVAVGGEASLKPNQIYAGDARELIQSVDPQSVALSIWSPPYFVGKSYERDWTFEEWQGLLSDVLQAHFDVVKPGGFVAVNIADILAFADPKMPRIQADVLSTKRSAVTREDVERAMQENPGMSRQGIAKILGCSEQTVQRRMSHNNVRGGKSAVQTKVVVVGGMLVEWAEQAGLYLYDRRVWQKDPAWMNSRWHSLSYRSVDEFEYIYIFWRPGITKVDRKRLTPAEWSEWGSRGVWRFPSVRANDGHEAMFPPELPARLIRLLSDPGDLVLDPFVGSGTTAVVAAGLGRQYMGFEIDDAHARAAQEAAAREKARYDAL